MATLEILTPEAPDELNSAALTLIEDNEALENGFYAPRPGELRQDRPPRPTHNGLGTLYIGTYATSLATHRVGIYKPEGYNPDAEIPIVAKTTALYTSAAGHNQNVAEKIMAMKHLVVVKGPPRYYGPTFTALSLAQDANEIHGLLNEVERAGFVESTEQVEVEGESQAAMKALGFIAIAESYGREVVSGLAVAPCYVVHKASLLKPWQLAGHGVSIAKGILHAAADSVRGGELEVLGGTLKVKDAHHHLIVTPVLTSGEAGRFLPHINPSQGLNVLLFGKDGASDPYRTKVTLDARFPNMGIDVIDKYGHIDGIMSPETAELRQKIFARSE